MTLLQPVTVGTQYLGLGEGPDEALHLVHDLGRVGWGRGHDAETEAGPLPAILVRHFGRCHAEAVAATVALDDRQHFTAKRRAIRTALVTDGVAAEIEALVDAILPP